MKRQAKYKPPPLRKMVRDDRQQAFEFKPGHVESTDRHDPAEFWKSRDGRYALLGGHMLRLYGTHEGERCGTCTNYFIGRCEAYNNGTGGWSREWPACGAWCMRDPRDRAALRGFTVVNGKASE